MGTKIIEKLTPDEAMKLRLKVMKEARSAYKAALVTIGLTDKGDHEFSHDEVFSVYRAIMCEISSDTHDGA